MTKSSITVMNNILYSSAGSFTNELRLLDLLYSISQNSTAYEVIYLSIMNYKITVTLIMWNIESAYDNPSHLDFFVGLLESNECLPIY